MTKKRNKKHKKKKNKSSQGAEKISSETVNKQISNFDLINQWETEALPSYHRKSITIRFRHQTRFQSPLSCIQDVFYPAPYNSDGWETIRGDDTALMPVVLADGSANFQWAGWM